MDENMAADVLTGTDASAESADFDGLFDMDGGEVTAEPQETEGQEGAAQAQEPEADPAEGTCADAQPGRQEQPGAEPKYKVKFYGQEQEMTVSELVAAAQKGLDYDNVRTRLEQAQQSAPAVQLVERYAAANGMTVEQYLQFANQGFEQQAVAQLVAQGVPEPAAKDLVAERLRLDRERRSIAPLAAQQRAQRSSGKSCTPWMELLQEYPGTKELPPEVAQRVAPGKHRLRRCGPLSWRRCAHSLRRRTPRRRTGRQRRAARAAWEAKREKTILKPDLTRASIFKGRKIEL